MLALRWSVPRRCLGVASRVVLVGATLAVAGCASDEEYRREVYGEQHAYAVPQHVRQGHTGHGQQGQPQRRAQAEVEDDGLPPQVAPPRIRRYEPDDPREPYSPNYGNPAATPRPAAPVSTPPRQAKAARDPAVAGWRRYNSQ